MYRSFAAPFGTGAKSPTDAFEEAGVKHEGLELILVVKAHVYREMFGWRKYSYAVAYQIREECTGKRCRPATPFSGAPACFGPAGGT